MIDSSEVYRILQSDGDKAAFNYIDSRLPFQKLTRITDTPIPDDILDFERELQINARAIKTTLSGGQHGHLGITMSASRYARFSNTAFPDDFHEGSDDSKYTGTMNDVERAVLHLVRQVLLRKIHASVHPDFYLYNDILMNQLEPIHVHISNIRDKFARNFSREEHEYLAAKDCYWCRNWMNCPTSFEIQAQSTPTNFKIYGDIAFTSTAVDNNSVPTKCNSTSTANNTTTERDMKRTEYRNTKGKGSTEYDKRKGACSNNSGVKSAINKQTTTATQQNSEVNLATKQCDQVPRVKNKENQQLSRVNHPVKLEPNVSAPRVTVNYISSIEQQQKSDNNNSSIQQQLPPILHDNKLPVIKKLDGKAGKAEKWQIACENGFGRMIPVTVPAI